MRRREPRATVLLAVGLLLATFATGCEPGEPEPPPMSDSPAGQEPWPDNDLDLVIDVRDEGEGKDPSFAVNPPTAHVTISTLGRGELRAVAGPAGTTAVAFPSVEQSSQGNIAALHAVIDKFSTVFSPDAEDFQFGADVYFSEPPRRATGDDGDNLIQRGLFGEKGQIKLQVDNGVPSCRIAGDQGEALIKGTRLAVGQWYRLRCQRDDDRVSLYVGRIRADGEVTRWALTSTTQPTGLIEFVGNRPAPVSIGGKLNPVGEVVADAPDQFNGALAHIVYDLH
ncbi:MAG: LamG domain-containing protein [Nocardioides sp.]